MAQYLVTTALTYANGPMHLGHWLEAIYADIYVRALRMDGHSVRFLSGDDAHGTPIMLYADKLSISPEQLVQNIHEERRRMLPDASICYDFYHTTHDEHNRNLMVTFYERFKEQGLLTTHTITQAFDEQAGLFLPDRFIKGTCPRCQTADQYGDSCEACGATYGTDELQDARSTLSGQAPTYKDTEHLFFDLERCRPMLESWLQSDACPPAVANKLREWFREPLRAWDVTRDAPYFGFEIPDRPGQYFYVWMDAPIGYMAAHQAYCEKHNCLAEFEQTWQPDSDVQLIHFIGKDITYFHGLFWPAMLHHAGFRLPNQLKVHGFLTLNGEKMSKSRGTFITIDTLMAHIPTEYLRYYLASKLNGHPEDIDLNYNELVDKINADLVGKVVNIASRCCKLLDKHFDNHLAAQLDTPQLIDDIIAQKSTITAAYSDGQLSLAVRQIMALSDQVNSYINDRAPWKTIKEADGREHCHQVLTTAINAFQLLMRYLTPILPTTAERVAKQLRCADRWHWQLDQAVLLDCSIDAYEHLYERLTRKQLPDAP